MTWWSWKPSVEVLTIRACPPDGAKPGNRPTAFQGTGDRDRRLTIDRVPDRDAAASVHRRSIDCVAASAIAEDRDGDYHPAEPVTRGQMASVLVRAAA